MIALSSLSCSYGSTPVLHKVSASFERGKLIAVIGKNGAGKSTLLKAILGQLPLTEGTVTLDSAPLASLSEAARAQKIAYVPQRRTTPDMDVETLVLHGRFCHLSYPRRYRDEDRDAARRAMDEMDVTRFAARTLTSLSGGEAQRAYLAQALCTGADFILLDEPTTHLDLGASLEIFRHLRALADTRHGVVCVLHDLVSAFTFADEVLLLDGGRIRAQGAPDTLYDSDAVRSLFGVRLLRDSFGYRYQLL